jgi:hypothetical protein
MNLGLHCERPATNHLNHGTALLLYIDSILFVWPCIINLFLCNIACHCFLLCSITFNLSTV